jgi:hypothetical protein
MIDDRYGDSTGERASPRVADRSGGAGVAVRVLQVALGLVVTVLVLRVLFALGGANHHNDFVRWVLNAGKVLSLGLDDVFPGKGAAKIAVNSGFVAVLYLVVGALVARLLRRS